MSTLFISDIHLCAQNSATTASFLHFLRTRALDAQALYILGDLFETWIGDDDPNPLHHEISVALQILGQRCIPCYFIHGNRDFLLGKRYAITCGMTLLSAPQVMQLDGLSVVILHGDTLCTDDSEYQNFRRLVHQRWRQRLFLSLPLPLRLRIANRMRAKSLHVNAIKTYDIMDVNTQAVMTLMAHTGAKVMIHGHTHLPAIHRLPGARCRVVLGAWHRHGSVIEVTATSVKLCEFSVKTTDYS
ncbi:UDP-2,3-diacylglucosamine hydrolase [Candidatus Moranella endobia PCVAL]|uniref:UDP-2,3-diacylglucosamine diphosphatase n=1 Tax=Candidatus Moranella endobia TaxID=1048758 RepID=UPI0002C6B6C3|nr:UDP-2,3-diacylglucosamine diphosphatase [Candidatus Moranella endobia]AGJ61422.1 UDP-2,3-diacylglucosamine hydrolase [Candidatus Moranella endobia PCVAL]